MNIYRYYKGVEMDIEFNAQTILIILGGVAVGWVLHTIKSFFVVKSIEGAKRFQEALRGR